MSRFGNAVHGKKKNAGIFQKMSPSFSSSTKSFSIFQVLEFCWCVCVCVYRNKTKSDISSVKKKINMFYLSRHFFFAFFLSSPNPLFSVCVCVCVCVLTSSFYRKTSLSFQTTSSYQWNSSSCSPCTVERRSSSTTPRRTRPCLSFSALPPTF